MCGPGQAVEQTYYSGSRALLLSWRRSDRSFSDAINENLFALLFVSVLYAAVVLTTPGCTRCIMFSSYHAQIKQPVGQVRGVATFGLGCAVCWYISGILHFFVLVCKQIEGLTLPRRPRRPKPRQKKGRRKPRDSHRAQLSLILF